MKSNNITFKTILYILIFCGSEYKSSAQFTPQKELPMERQILDTDRDIYFVSELVWFTLFNVNAQTNKLLDGSKVLYIELLNHQGIPIKQQMLCNHNNNSAGVLQLPDTISSGVYFLRSYSAWQRNFSEQNFSYKSIQVIHPDKHPQKNITTIKPFPLSINKSTIPDILSKKNFRNREKISINLDSCFKNINITKAWVSVCNKSLSINKNENVFAEFDHSLNNPKQLLHLPETSGYYINGQINRKITTATSANPLLLFIQNEKPFFLQTHYTPNGAFSLKVPLINLGTKEVTFYAMNTKNQMDIELQSKFDNRFSQPDSLFFYFDSTNILLLDKAYINYKLEMIHAQKTKNAEACPQDSLDSFFGIPSENFYPDEYNLSFKSTPYLFHEIVYSVRVQKRKDSTRISVKHFKTNFPMQEAPLVMINGTPVENPASILEIPVKSIKKIEVHNVPYTIAYKTFGGIINVITRNFKQRIPVSGNCFQTLHTFFEPQFSFKTMLPHGPNIPYFKNTLYWNPNINPSEKEISFYTSDADGKYTIELKAITDTGTIISKTVEFEVN